MIQRILQSTVLCTLLFKITPDVSLSALDPGKHYNREQYCGQNALFARSTLPLSTYRSIGLAQQIVISQNFMLFFILR